MRLLIPAESMVYVLFKHVLELLTLHNRGPFSSIFKLPISPTFCGQYMIIILSLYVMHMEQRRRRCLQF